ncbi:MAG TPA: glycosyltransferase family 87 protein [Pirellulales bacterium]|jgi:hypothetical protein
MGKSVAQLWRRIDASFWPTSGERPTLLYRLAICAWFGFVVAVSVKMIASPYDHNNYLNFETGGRAWWTDAGLYEPDVPDFRYLPPFAVAMTPMTVLPSRLGALFWIWLNLGVFLWSLRALVRDILPSRLTADQEGAFLLLTLVGACRVFWCAQTNMLVIALVVLAMQAILRKRWRWAATLLALPFYIKFWPLAAAMLVIACWPRQLAWRFACAMVAIGATPFLTRSATFVFDQYSKWGSAFVGRMQMRHDYLDAWTVWDLIHKPVNEQAYLALQLGTAILVFALVIWQKRRSNSEPQWMIFILGMWTAWQLTFGPGAERATFGLIAPVTAWGLITGYRMRFQFAALLIACGLTFLGTLGEVERALMESYPIVTIAHPVGVALFALWLVAYAQREFVPSASSAAAAPNSVPSGALALKGPIATMRKGIRTQAYW